MRKGFVDTCVATVGWFVSIVLAFVWQDQARELIRENTNLYSSFYTAIYDHIHLQGGTESLLSRLPVIARDQVDPLSSFSQALAENITDFLFGVLAFLVVVAAVKLVLWIVRCLFSKENRDGLLGFTDGLFGTVAGVVRGMVLIYLFLALLVPVGSFLQTDLIASGLESSHLAQSLYDSNPVLLLFNK